MRKNIVSFAFVGLSFISPLQISEAVSFDAIKEIFSIKPLARETMGLTDRYPDKWVNGVFADNILLSLHYLNGEKPANPDWEKIRQPFEVEFTLKPNEVFAFHEDVLPEYKTNLVKSIGVKFNSLEGFKSDGWLVGDGVCHLASLMNWAARKAGLEVEARVNHDFAPVPNVPREYGTAIFWGNQNQNLYIKNTYSFPVKFSFNADSDKVALTLSK